MSYSYQITHKFSIIAIFSTLVTSWGCVSSPVYELGIDRPYPAVSGRTRSIVHDSPGVRWYAQYTGTSNEIDSPAWYDYHNDRTLVAYTAYPDVTVDETYTVTIDRQVVVNGKSRDHYSTTTYRRHGTGNYR